MTPATAEFIDTKGDYWRICPHTRHYERCIDGVWMQDDSADELYPLNEAAPNCIKHTYKEEYSGRY